MYDIKKGENKEVKGQPVGRVSKKKKKKINSQGI